MIKQQELSADQYMKHWKKNKVWTHLAWPKHQERLRRCAEYMIGNKFLDVGCAYGHSTYIMSGFREGEWAGLDFSKDAMRHAQRIFPQMKFYYSPDFNMLSVCGEFDSVVCSEVIEHVKNDVELLEGLLKITKRILVLTTPNRYVSDPGHLRIYNQKTLINLMHSTNSRHSYNIEKRDTFWYVIIGK